MVNPILITRQAPTRVFLNLSGNVGPNSPNHLEDVQLVQLGYFALSQASGLTPALQAAKPIFATVVPGATYNGGASDPLTLSIQAHEAARGGPQDGHVSVMPQGTLGSYDPAHTFIMISLNNNIKDLAPNDFPRIDKLPRCPQQLKAAVIKMFLG